MARATSSWLISRASLAFRAMLARSMFGCVLLVSMPLDATRYSTVKARYKQVIYP